MMTRDDKILAEARQSGSPRAFGITMALVSAVLALVPLLSAREPRWWLVGLAGVLLATSWLRASLLAPANRAWLAFAQRLHKVSSLVVLGVMFFGVLSPVAVAMRAFGSDRLRLKPKPGTQSYWLERDGESLRPDFERPF